MAIAKGLLTFRSRWFLIIRDVERNSERERKSKREREREGEGGRENERKRNKRL